MSSSRRSRRSRSVRLAARGWVIAVGIVVVAAFAIGVVWFKGTPAAAAPTKNTSAGSASSASSSTTAESSSAIAAAAAAAQLAEGGYLAPSSTWAGVEPFYSGPYTPCPTTSTTPASSGTSASGVTSSSTPSARTPSTCDYVPPQSTGPGTPEILPTYRIVSYYGNPESSALGILGEYPLSEVFAKLDAQAAVYQGLDPSHPVLRALELIAVVAQGSPGPGGAYAADMPASMIDEYISATRARGDLLILDLQVGRSSIQSQVTNMLPYLKFPNVELALDPEFDMSADEIPGQEIGSISTTAINWTINTLSQLVEQDDLPQKVLIVHEFRASMFPDPQGVELKPGVAFITDIDGWGTQADKLKDYRDFVTNQLIQYGGMKLFYKYDINLLTPEQVLALNPAPLLVIYQ